MSRIKELETQRDAVLEETRSIRSMRRGTIAEQYLKVKHKGKKEPVLRVPYYLMSRKEDKRTVGVRLTLPAEPERARKDVAAYKRFVKLCKQFDELTERLGELEHRCEDVEAQESQGRNRIP